MIPWRLTGAGIAAEGIAALAAAAGIVAIALWWRGRGDEGQFAAGDPFAGVISRHPTEPATFTPAPPSSATLPPSTPFPPTSTPLPPVIDYSVQSGDTLYGIAIQHGVSLDDILEANNETLESVHSLSIGQVLRIPIRSADAVADVAAGAEEATSDEADPGTQSEDPPVAAAVDESPDPEAVAEVQPAAPPAEPIILREAKTYTIGRGDTLGRIAVEHGVRVEDLVALNELSGPSAILSVGDSLLVEPALIATAVPATSAPVTKPDAASVPLDNSRIAALPDDEVGDIEPEFPSPIELAPLNGALVIAETALLRWASVGRMPFGVFYVVEIREVGDEIEEPEDAEMIWLRTDATGLRVPAQYRPALGARRQLAWRVTIRREGSFSVGRGTLLSQPNPWQVFEWTPGGSPDTLPIDPLPVLSGTSGPTAEVPEGAP